ncbi:MAG: LLM class flavin-dependent oxidoreductase [Thermoleophilia bacterium]
MSRPLEISCMGPARPPSEAAVGAAARREADGYDAMWWADHLLHWFPMGIWDPELVPQAAAQPSPHVWFDPVPVIAQSGLSTKRIRLGIGVTDLVRRNPASLAQTALTLDHLTGGRFMLGIGTGEQLNLGPYGMTNARPLRRLEEGIEVMRLLMSDPGPVDYAGEIFTLEGACMGVRPVGDRPPPIWVGAHRPKGLALVGRLADGWLPLATDVDGYSAMLAQVRAAQAAAGRALGDVTAGAYCRVVVADSIDDARQVILNSLLFRFIALTRPSEAFEAAGVDHPLGKGVFGITELQPMAIGRDEALALAAAVPDEVLLGTVIHGTPDDIASGVRALADAGAQHVQLTNMTPLCDPSRAAASEALLGEAVATIRSGEST